MFVAVARWAAISPATITYIGEVHVTNRPCVLAFLAVCGLAALAQAQTFDVLYNFTGSSDGGHPYAGLVQDSTGKPYGTVEFGGSRPYYGAVFELNTAGKETVLHKFAGNPWKVSKTRKETILRNFNYLPSDACNPAAGVTLDSKGNLYGVSLDCGADYGGALYQFSIADGTLTLLHSFDYKDGEGLMCEVWRTNKGVLFGIASSGGTYGYGTVWSFAP